MKLLILLLAIVLAGCAISPTKVSRPSRPLVDTSALSPKRVLTTSFNVKSPNTYVPKSVYVTVSTDVPCWIQDSTDLYSWADLIYGQPVTYLASEEKRFFRAYLPATAVNNAVLPPNTVHLTWDAPSGSVAGYKLYWSGTSSSYVSYVDVGNVLDAVVTLTNQAGEATFFAATVYDSEGNESEFSNEVIYTTPASEQSPPSVKVPVVFIKQN